MKVRVVRTCDYVPAHLRRGPMKYTEIEVSEKEMKSMKFSEVIAALEEGKKVRLRESPGDYYQVVGPDTGLKAQLVHVYPDGSWVAAQIIYDGLSRSDWTVVE